jgi:type VI protein secretion system component VasF
MLAMDITDALGLAWRMAGRRIRQVVSAVLIGLMICCPAAVTTALTWYAAHQAHQIQREIQRIIPTPQPTVTHHS